MADFCLRIDDTDPRIHYSGPWQTLTNTTNPKDFPSSTFYNGTLHGTGSNSTTFSFSYQGLPTVAIFGNATGLSGNIPVSCSLENSKGKSIASSFNFNSVLDAPLCSFAGNTGAGTAVPDSYVLKFNTANGTVNSSDPQICIDYIVYQPFSNVSLGNQDVVQVGNCLSLNQFQDLQFGPGWESGGRLSGQMVDSLKTSLAGSPITLKFNGTSVGLEAVNNGSSGTGHYSLDGNDPVGFFLSQSIAPSRPNNYLLFLESSLTPAEHTLTVQTDGDGGSLVVNSLFYTPFASREQTGPSSSNLPAPTAPSGREGSENHSKAIIAGVIAGVAAVLLMLASVFFVLRRRRQSRAFSYSLEVPPSSYMRRNSSPQDLGEMIYTNFKQMPLADSSASSVGAPTSDISRAPSVRLSTLKLQQRLEVQSQLRKEEELARNQAGPSNTSRDMTMIQSPIHVDSGLRLGPQGEIRNTELQGAPPQYTAE
ncbi:hypothetical protein GYMLUDRAFT_73388 [Collybiopsis luxurians FD-317 M1]|uniref:Uncharacterized protein n=1 Tax=Collybiopsis luxurians FD-317 M1 TaxID=944289 RepID=A0A0D0CFP4_9AGAR|nr:hypothetical protein GYMLUDRAFT_73388 [Collybiopsis luxurians FD-317 M1]